MCEAMRRLMQDEIADEVREAEIRAQRDGEMKARRETAINMKKKGYADSTIADLLDVGLNMVQQWVSGVASLVK